MTKTEIQSTFFAIHQSITQRDNICAFYNFYTFIKLKYQQNSDIINDIINYVLWPVLSNKVICCC